MSDKLEKDLKGYYRDIKKALAWNKKSETVMMKEIRAGVASYLTDHPDAAIDDVITYVGKPSEIADGYYGNKTGREIEQELKWGNKVIRYLIIGVLIAVAIYVLMLITSQVVVYCISRGYIEAESVIVISEADYPLLHETI